MSNFKELSTKIFESLSKLEDGERVTTKALYEQFKDQISEVQFRALVSHLVNSGIFTGFSLKRGRTGGLYVEDRSKVDPSCLDSVSEDDLALLLNPQKKPKQTSQPEVEEDDEVVATTAINLTKTLRFCALNANHWGYQRKVGDLWVTRGYYSDLETALEMVAKQVVDERLKNVSAKSMTALAVDIRTLGVELREMLSEAFSNKSEAQAAPESKASDNLNTEAEAV